MMKIEEIREKIGNSIYILTEKYNREENTKEEYFYVQGLKYCYYLTEKEECKEVTVFKNYLKTFSAAQFSVEKIDKLNPYLDLFNLILSEELQNEK